MIHLLQSQKNFDNETLLSFIEDTLLNGFFAIKNGRVAKKRKRKSSETLLQAIQTWNLCDANFYTSISAIVPQEMQEERFQAFSMAKTPKLGTRAWAPFLPPPLPHSSKGLKLDRDDQNAINTIQQNYLNEEAKTSVVQVCTLPFWLPSLIILLAIRTISR